MNSCRVDFDALPWINPAPGVRYKVHKLGHRQLRLAEFAEGFVEPDWCTKGHVGYVLAGTGVLQLENQTVPLGPGDGVFLQAGPDWKHKLKVTAGPFLVVLVEDLPR
jgi:quercetin dioxygenase-like cupin family protein